VSATSAFVYPLSWGAQFLGRDEVRFRLWAPQADTVDLELAGKRAPMQRSEDGWFELVADGVAVGAAYSFLLPGGEYVPDPAARAQVSDVHGPSRLLDPSSYGWRNGAWRGRPWEEAIIYELHVGAFTPQGTFAAAREKLGYLADLGVTAIELMPVAQFGGNRGWGYDGVLPYTPHSAYGTPDDMKAFIDAAHDHRLMVLLDVVYNHFGPDGNYLHLYAGDFFHERRRTPWGKAIAYERAPVRGFFIENALYWLHEYQLDGLRLDAVDNIVDDLSEKELLVEIAERVRSEFPTRQVHLTTEDNRNITRLHERGPTGEVQFHTAEWNDDFHNVAHVVLTGETEAYYSDFAEEPWKKLARALAEGFVYQGETSDHEGGVPRGAPSAHLPPTAFVDFLQNHDQTGNRAFGERLTTLTDQRRLELMGAVLLLSPHVPLLFMGEEYGETRPFLFFTDFHGELARTVREGRRAEFAKFSAFAGHGDVPDPNAPETFLASKLDWSALDRDTGKETLGKTRKLLRVRREHLFPMLAAARGNSGSMLAAEKEAIAIDWQLGQHRLSLRANFSSQPRHLPVIHGEIIYADPHEAADSIKGDRVLMPPLSLLVAKGPA
jgi:malto-oligosyltrehalose trehalohydrolase